MNALVLAGWTSGTAALGAAAWHWDLWLLPAAWIGTSSALAMRRSRLVGLRATRIAAIAQALHPGFLSVSAAELIVARDLAAQTSSAPARLVEAKRLVEHLHDPWRRELGAARLEAAAGYLSRGEVPSAQQLDETAWRFAGCVAAVAAIVGVAIGSTTGSRLAMAAAVCCYAVVGGAIGAWQARVDPAAIAAAAAGIEPLPVDGGYLDEQSLVDMLTQLGNEDPRVFVRAESMATPQATWRIRSAAAGTRSRRDRSR